jgi:beta-galactosidase
MTAPRTGDDGRIPHTGRIPVLARHDLIGPQAGHRGVESATRVTPDGARLLLLLDHGAEHARLTHHAAATDLLTGKRHDRGEALVPDPRGVAVLRLQ